MPTQKRILLILSLPLVLLAGINLTRSHSNEIAVTCETLKDNFAEWSNSLPEREATLYLQSCLNKFSSVEDAAEWLKKLGWSVEPPQRMLDVTATNRGIATPASYMNAGWNVDQQGTVFAHSFFSKLHTALFVHGVMVSLSYSDPFTLHRVEISRTIL